MSADAIEPGAIEREMKRSKSLKVTLPNIVDDKILNDLNALKREKEFI